MEMELDDFLEEMMNSGNQLLMQCAFNIKIDIKYSLVPHNYYEKLAKRSKNYSTFIESFEKQFHICCKQKSLQYATIIPSNVYRNYFQPGGNSTDKKRFDIKDVFDKTKIEQEGWAGYKGVNHNPVIWITPYAELKEVIKFCIKERKNISNFLYDYIGVYRNSNLMSYFHQFDTDKSVAIIIKYSDELNIDLFHPNCTIPYGWNKGEKYSNLFLSFGNPMDEYGRTYNELEVVGHAKERIHKNFMEIDEKYGIDIMPDFLEFENVETFDRTKLLEEAKRRLIT